MLYYNPRLKTKARSQRANPTDAELRLWYRLRRKQILALSQAEYDKRRSEYLEQWGLRVYALTIGKSCRK
jgi:very-short-patch-repair endonuclease